MSNRTGVLVAKEIAGQHNTLEFWLKGDPGRARRGGSLDAVERFRYTEVFKFA